MNQEIAHRETLTALMGIYKQETENIRKAYAMLDTAEKKLATAFHAKYFSTIPRTGYNSPTTETAEKVVADIHRQAWIAIVDRFEIKKILSIKRREELDKQLNGDSRGYDKPAPLPELTAENILAMFNDVSGKATEYANEAVFEVFDWLRPHRGHTSDLKTNDKWLIGKKVIMGYMVEMGYGKSGTFRVRYGSDKNLIALDNVFHMLDGRGPLKSYYGPLVDAINTSPDGTGETDFFKFKCCKNHNLHIEFKRPDLVQKINKTAGNRSQIGN